MGESMQGKGGGSKSDDPFGGRPGGHRFVAGRCACGQTPSDDPKRCPHVVAVDPAGGRDETGVTVGALTFETSGNPEPAVGQVWRLDHPSFAWAGPLVVEQIDAERDEVRFLDGCGSALSALRGGNPDWRCVGVQTGHGRVMVGERRRSKSGWTWTVRQIDVEPGFVALVPDGSDLRSLFRPDYVADQMDLLPPAPGPLAKAADGAVRSPPPAYVTREDIGRALRPALLPLGLTITDWRGGGPLDTAVQTIERLLAAGYEVRPDIAERLGIPIAPATPPDDCPVGTVSRVLGKTADGGTLVEVAVTPPPYPKRMPLPECAHVFEQAKREEREVRRREIDAVMREDARRFPAFATARRCAVLAACERETLWGKSALRTLLADLHAYEAARGGMREPSPQASTMFANVAGWVGQAVTAYERARALP